MSLNYSSVAKMIFWVFISSVLTSIGIFTPYVDTSHTIAASSVANFQKSDDDYIQEAAPQAPLGEWVQIPMPTDCDIFSSDFAGEADGWAVGACGKKYLHWDGKNWSDYPMPENTQTPWFVDILALDDGWIVGAQGMLMHWDGSKWELMAPEAEYDLLATSFLSQKLGWAVGGNIGYTPTDLANYSIVLKWNGVEWKKVPNPGRYPLTTIVMLSEEDGWAAGDLGELLHWDGHRWKDFPAPDKDLVEGFTALSFVAPDNGWLVGGSVSEDWGVILHWDGKSWTEVQRTKHYLLSIAMVDSEFGWAVGGNNNNNFGGSVILHWDGKTWEEYPSPTELPLNFVWANTRDDGWLFAGGESLNTSGEGNALFRYVINPPATSTPVETAGVNSTITPKSTITVNSVTITPTFLPTIVTSMNTTRWSTNSLSVRAIVLTTLLIALIMIGALIIRHQRMK